MPTPAHSHPGSTSTVIDIPLSTGAPDAAGLRVDAHGVAHLRPGSGMDGPGLFSLELVHDLDARLDEVERCVADGSLRCLVLRLGLPSTAHDLDIEQVRRLPDVEAARVWAREGQRVVGRIAALGVPTVAAIEGRCFWGGLQTALACSYRLAVGATATRLGFPETGLGILPAWGGTMRLPRLIGSHAALELMLRHGSVSVRRAESLGLVDDAYSESSFEARLAHFARNLAARGHRGAPRRGGLVRRVFEDTAPGRRVVFARGARRARRQARYPRRIADAVLLTMLDGVAFPQESALAREADTFANLLCDGLPRALLHHHALRETDSERPATGRRGRALRRAAVIGAGERGTLLSYLLASHGFTVRLKDLRRDSATRAVERIRARVRMDSEEGRIEPRDAERRSRRLTGTTGFGGFGRVDVVIEAVAERDEVKRSVLSEVEQHVRDTCLLLTTSPFPPLRTIGGDLQRPGLVAGLHLFHPAGRRPLAEVVRGPGTTSEAIDAACGLARGIGKRPVVVSSSPGLVAWRLAVPYVNEALWSCADGADPDAVDGAMLAFGMAVAPLRLWREVGAPAYRRLADGLAERLGDRFRLPPAPSEPVQGAAARLARRLVGGLRSRASGRPEALADLQQRMLLAMLNEAARLLADGVVPSGFELDRAVDLAFGWPAERGGLLFHTDAGGLAETIDSLERLANAHGPRFEPAPLLLELLHAGRDLASWQAPPCSSPPAAGQALDEVLT